jgi:hypothetical protein
MRSAYVIAAIGLSALLVLALGLMPSSMLDVALHATLAVAK